MLIPKVPPPKGPPPKESSSAKLAKRVVVDGSNLATEGRSMPNLVQLDEAVRAYREEHPDDEIIVVVDASFGYRIDPSELAVFEEAEEAGEIVSPPAGAIGRGDGFLLRIADRIDAVVLSNDSFQEFHGEYGWLFEEGRLVGGKPVPSVGWIFTPRTPVRGPKSRVAVRDAKARRRVAPPPTEPVRRAIAEATAEAVSPEEVPARQGRPRGTATSSPEAVNDPLPFITFIAEHPLGSEVEGVVDTFTSHGAFVMADGARCYAPVSGLGDPAPRSAKDVLKRGDSRMFVVQALDAPRRGIELALPGLAKVSGTPTDETVEAEIDVGVKARSRRSRRPKSAAEVPAEIITADRRPGHEPLATADAADVDAVGEAPAKRTTPRRSPARKRAAEPMAPAPAEPQESLTHDVSDGKADVTTSAGRTRGAATKKAPAAKKAVSKRVAVSTSAPTASPPKKVAPKKAAIKRVSVKKVSVKKVAVKKVAAKKVPPKTDPVTNIGVRKTAVKRVVTESRTAEGVGDAATEPTVVRKRAAAKKSPATKRSQASRPEN